MSKNNPFRDARVNIPRFHVSSIFYCIIICLRYFVGMKDQKHSIGAAPAATADGAAVSETAAPGRSGRARTGKIARLPHAVREALNQRLRDGLAEAEILPWLNSLPEARKILQKHFDGSPISEQNLSRWRCGGYEGWLENQQAREAIYVMSAAGRNIDPAKREALTNELALVVTARMVAELRKFDKMPEGPRKTAAWRQLVWSLVLLRRSEFYAGKLRLDQDRFAPKKKPGEKPLCAEEQQERFNRIMGLGGPHWNNFETRWEGEGAAEMTEKEEVKRLVVEELRRRKAAREAAPPQPATPEKAVGPQIDTVCKPESDTHKIA